MLIINYVNPSESTGVMNPEFYSKDSICEMLDDASYFIASSYLLGLLLVYMYHKKHKPSAQPSV